MRGVTSIKWLFVRHILLEVLALNREAIWILEYPEVIFLESYVRD